MTTYSSFGASSNAEVADDAERTAERWARRISRDTGVSYSYALAVVHANIRFKEARHG